jgi:ribonuclease HI
MQNASTGVQMAAGTAAMHECKRECGSQNVVLSEGNEAFGIGFDFAGGGIGVSEPPCGFTSQHQEGKVEDEVIDLLDDLLHQVAGEEGLPGNGTLLEATTDSNECGDQVAGGDNPSGNGTLLVDTQENVLLVRFDGASRGNHTSEEISRGAVGALAYRLGQDGMVWPLEAFTDKVDDPEQHGITNNVAEYYGALAAVKLARENAEPNTAIFIQGDNSLVINQIKGTFNCTDENLKKLLALVLQELEELQMDVTWSHIYREFNREAML